ncbi:conserved membrane protein of unknown function [Candidatus Hydrogenisulfobacillus filiaventi]|uniref:ABC transporter permease n=1 Tax=Candidatus Hydrogenisulfobacillus filiaventi TaxID=2707344 RepID=A0A6F8ZEI0_9FIRM|nr:conserved membrane protein of unknown function [Candidatus Hydrogenisulfobacillus filiaventi]
MWWALFDNEWRKLWARRGRLLVAGTLALAALTVFATWRGQAAQEANLRQQAALNARALAALRARAAAAPPAQQTLIHEQEAAMAANLVNLEGVPVRQQLQEDRRLARHAPRGQAGALEETVALDRYRLAHGIIRLRPWHTGAWRLAGLVLTGPAILGYALLALGVTADLVAGEVQDGTLSFLFLHGQRRGAIYLAKLATGITAGWGSLAGGSLLTWLGAALLVGTGSPWAPHVVGARLVKVTGSFPPVQPAGPPFPILPQWAFDLWALVLALVAAGVWVAVVLALSRLTRSVTVTLVLGTAGLIGGLFLSLAGWAGLLSPTVHLAPMADWDGSTAGVCGIPAAGLPLGLGVLAGWGLAALAYGWSRFGRLEP